MATYIVTYDLNNETTRPNILKSIRENFNGFAKLSESSYAISTSLTPDQVHNNLSRFLDSDDTIYIISLSRPYSGRGPKNVNAWLEDNLPY